MSGLKKSCCVLLLALAAVAMMVAEAPGQCESPNKITTWCGYQCDYWGSGMWLCLEENPSRCCFEHPDGACGDATWTECPECVTGTCGF